MRLAQTCSSRAGRDGARAIKMKSRTALPIYIEPQSMSGEAAAANGYAMCVNQP